MATDQQIVDELRKASAGLILVSESDYPLTVIQWDGKIEVSPRFLCGLTEEPESPVAEIPLAQLFSDGRFDKLTNSLRFHLKDVKAYKVGNINMPVYVVGKSPEGNWLGVSSRLVQT